MPFSSLFLGSATLVKLAVLSFLSITPITALIQANISEYQLQASFSGEPFTSNFNFITGPDPDGGWVNWVDETAADNGYEYQMAWMGDDGAYYLRLGSYNQIDPNGPARPALKLVSKQSWKHGLFIADIKNMPNGMCGMASKHYLLGTGPSSEIDIISGVNEITYDLASLFTEPTCSIATNAQTGSLMTSDCGSASGCGILDDYDTNSFGTQFNSNNGGVYATEWTSDFINVWFFERGTVPSDITSGQPNPGLWGVPMASFEGSCDIDEHFSCSNIVFDMNFCTPLAVTNWATTECSNQASTCQDYIATDPEELYNMYWAIYSVQVYQIPSDAVSTCSSAAASSTSSSASSSTSAAASSTSPSATSSTSTMSAAQSSSTGSSSSVSTPSAAQSSSTASSSSSAVASSTSAAVSSTTSSSAAPSSTCIRLGCYTESGATTPSRTLYDYHYINYSNMSPEICASACAGYSYFGVEFSGECYCGNQINSASYQVPDSQCAMPCGGNPNEFCGAGNRLDVYSCVGPLSSSSSAAASTSSSSTSSTSSADPPPLTSPSASASTSSTSSSLAASSSSSSVDPPAAAVASSSSTTVSSSGSTTCSTSLSISTPPSSTATPAISQSPPYTTSTIYATTTYTITSCAATVTDCPARIGKVTTETISLYTTFCPVEDKSTPTPLPSPYVAQEYTTSTVYTTTVYTITSCAATVTDCPARIGQITTETIALYTTVCPVVDNSSPTPVTPGPAIIVSTPLFVSATPVKSTETPVTPLQTAPGAAAPEYPASSGTTSASVPKLSTGSEAGAKSTYTVVPVQASGAETLGFSAWAAVIAAVGAFTLL